MHRIFLPSAAALALVSYCCAPPEQVSALEAIERVESGADANAPPGDHGKAVGILQIHAVMVEDVNRISGRHFTLVDRADRVKSEAMFWIYTEHYSRHASAELVARRWNGGPHGELKAATAPYWAKVKAAMEKPR